MTDTVRLLDEGDAEAWFALRQEMLVDTPYSFLASPEDDSAASVEVVRERLAQGPRSVIVGAFEQGALLGVVGLYQEKRLKTQHKAWIWGVYTTPRARGRGLGARMLEAAVAHGRGLEGVQQLNLSVSALAPGAQRLYERAGFRVWGTEPRGMQVDGRLHDEVHMLLRFDE